MAAQVEAGDGGLGGGARWQVAMLNHACSRAARGPAEALCEPSESAPVCALGLVEEEHREAGRIPTGVGCSLHVACALQAHTHRQENMKPC